MIFQLALAELLLSVTHLSAINLILVYIHCRWTFPVDVAMETTLVERDFFLVVHCGYIVHKPQV